MCRPPAQIINNVEANFRTTIRSVRYDGGSNAREMKAGDFVRTHEGDFWGNVEEFLNGEVKVRGYCTGTQSVTTRPYGA
jgi:hypothetical protein